MTYTYTYPRPAVTVDALVFRNINSDIQILLIKRANPRFENMWAAPGGFMDMDETPEAAVVRELKEETGITGVTLFQYHTYGAIGRDPRHRTISIAYAGLITDNTQQAIGGDDAAEAAWFSIKQLPPLAFDHALVVTGAVDFGKNKGWF